MGDSGREPTIYDVARVAGVAPSTVSRALAKPGRVSYRTAEHVRRVAEDLGYRSAQIDLPLSARGTGLLAVIVADIANPVFVGMIRGAEGEATQHGLTLAIIETQESREGEQRDRAAGGNRRRLHPRSLPVCPISRSLRWRSGSRWWC